MDSDMDETFHRREPQGNTQEANNNNNGIAAGHTQDQDETDILIPPFLSQSQSRIKNSSPSTSSSIGNESADSKKLWEFFKMNKKDHGEDIRGPLASCHAQAFEYKMDHQRRGKAIIFNHNKFHSCQELTDRPGSDKDAEDLNNSFRRLGFEVETYHNQTFEKILCILEQAAANNHEDEDCIVIIVMTHGKSDLLHAYDIGYKPDNLWNLFTADKCSTLAGKPKMFFIQACRGDKFDHGTNLMSRKSRTVVDGSGDIKSYKIPNQADMLTVFSTTEANEYMSCNSLVARLFQYLSLSNSGHFSWRSNVRGGCFIQALCRQLDRYASELDLLSLITRVNHEVAINYESNVPRDVTQHQKKQVPHVSHTLTRLIRLAPKTISTLV